MCIITAAWVHVVDDSTPQMYLGPRKSALKSALKSLPAPRRG